jgi:uncharacterized SAM-binding protein YcdF (DUF218 family)
MKYIVALGKGIEISNGKISPTIGTVINTLAAYVLLQNGVGDKIIFSGGHTKGESKPSEARVMLDYLKKSVPRLSNNKVILEGQSIDTAGNAEEVGELIDSQSELLLVTTGSHLARAAKLFNNYGVRINKIYASEKVLKQQSPRFDFILNSYGRRKKIWEAIYESACFILVNTLDPKGKILRKITSTTRT